MISRSGPVGHGYDYPGMIESILLPVFISDRQTGFEKSNITLMASNQQNARTPFPLEAEQGDGDNICQGNQ